MEYIIITNFILTIICYIIFWRKNSFQEKVYKVILALFIPVAGIICVFASEKIRWNKSNVFDNLDAEENKVDEGTVSLEGITHIDVQRQINIVPVEEALILNKSLIKRKILIDVLKNEPEKYINILKMALNDDDTETSHYAAVAILEIKRLLNSKIQQSETKIIAHKSMSTSIEYLENIKKLVLSDLLDSKSQKKFNELYSLVLEQIVNDKNVPSKYIEEKIHLEIENINYDKALQLCEKLELLYPNKEETFLVRLRLCYEMKDLDRFKKTIDYLNNLSIDLSYKSAEILRFWMVKAS